MARSRDNSNFIVPISDLLLHLSVAGSATVADAIRIAGVSDTTARRWLRALAAGRPDQFALSTEGDRGLLTLRRRNPAPRPDRETGVPATEARRQGVSPMRLGAVRLARHALSMLRESALDDELAGIASDILAQLDPDASNFDHVTQALDRLFVVRARIVKPHAGREHVDTVVSALLQRCVIEIDYTTFTMERLVEEVEPLTMAVTDDGLFLLARVRTSPRSDRIGEVRQFQFARIGSVQKLRRLFDYPTIAEHDPESMWKHCFGAWLPEDAAAAPEEVEVVFAHLWRHYLTTSPAHPTQRGPFVEGDAAVRFTYRVHVTPDFVRWLRGFGKDLLRTSPEGLVQRQFGPTGSA